MLVVPLLIFFFCRLNIRSLSVTPAESRPECRLVGHDTGFRDKDFRSSHRRLQPGIVCKYNYNIFQ